MPYRKATTAHKAEFHREHPAASFAPPTLEDRVDFVPEAAEETAKKTISRRGFFRLAGLATAVAVVHYGLNSGERPSLVNGSTSTDNGGRSSAKPITETSPTGGSGASEIDHYVDYAGNPGVTPEAQQFASESIISYGEYAFSNGKVIATLTAESADGEELFIGGGAPLIANLAYDDANEQLSRGAFVEVRKNAINPQEIRDDAAVPGDEALFGEAGAIFITAHRTELSDEPGDMIPAQPVFYNLHKFNTGTVLTVDMGKDPQTEQPRIAKYRYVATEVVEHVDVDMQPLYRRLREQPTDGSQLVRLVACHDNRTQTYDPSTNTFKQVDKLTPSARDRIIVTLERIQ